MISFFDEQARWAFVVGLSLGAGIGVLYGYRIAFLQMHWARIVWHEVRRWNRMRVRRSDRKWRDRKSSRRPRWQA